MAITMKKANEMMTDMARMGTTKMTISTNATRIGIAIMTNTVIVVIVLVQVVIVVVIITDGMHETMIGIVVGIDATVVVDITAHLIATTALRPAQDAW
jgi:hypothetical protein